MDLPQMQNKLSSSSLPQTHHAFDATFLIKKNHSLLFFLIEKWPSIRWFNHELSFTRSSRVWVYGTSHFALLFTHLGSRKRPRIYGHFLCLNPSHSMCLCLLTFPPIKYTHSSLKKKNNTMNTYKLFFKKRGEAIELRLTRWRKKCIELWSWSFFSTSFFFFT